MLDAMWPSYSTEEISEVARFLHQLCWILAGLGLMVGLVDRGRRYPHMLRMALMAGILAGLFSLLLRGFYWLTGEPLF